MKTDLKNYMEERDRLRNLEREPGPVVTISRQFGCEAEKVTKRLIARIAEVDHVTNLKARWDYIDKEALEEASIELGIPVHEINHRFLVEHSPIQDMFTSFNSQYTVSDERIADSMLEVLATYIRRGKVVIIGRGAAHLTKKLKNAVNISLYAPFEHRMDVISKTKDMSALEAKKLILDVDKQRMIWRENFTGEKFDLGIYDATLNTQRLSVDQVVDVIISIMREKGILRKS